MYMYACEGSNHSLDYSITQEKLTRGKDGRVSVNPSPHLSYGYGESLLKHFMHIRNGLANYELQDQVNSAQAC